MIEKSDKIYIAGHRGMVGSACLRILEKQGYWNIVGKSSSELDLRDQKAVEEFISREKPSVIIDAAARVGGILANDTFPYEFLMDNMLIQNNLIRSAHNNNVPNFIFLGSSCIYPKHAPQPLKEEYLLTDSLEPTNEWYALAKITGVKLIESLKKQFGRNYIALMPTNLFGINDNFDLKSSHVLPAMLRKFHEAQINNHSEVELWGDGSPMREFLYVDDLAKAVLFSLEKNIPSDIYNVGTGKDIRIDELAVIIQRITGFRGNVIWNKNMPNGTPRKVLDTSKINTLGWTAETDLIEGINRAYEWFLKK